MLTTSFFLSDICDIDKLKFDGIDIAFLNFGGEISLSDELENPDLCRDFARVSQENEILLLVHFVAKIKDKSYLSVMVIDKGKIIGVSDCLTREDYYCSLNQRIYMTSFGRVGVIVDEDFFYAESVRSLYLNGADFIVCMTKKAYSKRFIDTLKAHKIFNDLDIFIVFADKLCYFSEKLKIKDLLNGINVDIKKKKSDKESLKKFAYPTFEY